MEPEPRTTRQGAVALGSTTEVKALRTLSCEELAERSKEGCQASFGQLVERYAPRLVCFLRRRTSSIHDAEDLVQDTFVKAFENIQKYHKGSKFSTWLFTIAAHLATSHYRKTHAARDCSKFGSYTTCPSTILVQREERQGLWSRAMELPENQYQVLWLKYAEDMSVKEIARVMGKSRASIKVLLYRSRTNLAGRLQDQIVDENGMDWGGTKREFHRTKTENV
jgi:RNA polymerase sigma-70 factor (ECF subfamily)